MGMGVGGGASPNKCNKIVIRFPANSTKMLFVNRHSSHVGNFQCRFRNSKIDLER